jgi:predicted permease
MKALIRELRLAERSLRRDPVFSLTAVLTLALGIGATTAVFSVLYGVLLAPLPFLGGESLVRLHSTNLQQNIVRGQMSPPDMWNMRVDSRSVEAASPIYPYEGTLEDDAGNPIRIPAYVVSSDFFEVFSTPMVLGRGFLPEEDESDSPMEVVISHQLWRSSALGGDPDVIGRSFTIDAGTAVVVGGAPPDLRYPLDAALWALPGFNWQNMARRGRSWDVVARLAPGVTVAEAQTELSIIASRLENEFVQWNNGVGVEVVPLKESIVGDLGLALLILMAASAGLLAVAASNVANLMLARGAARLQETALRAALGASRLRIVGTLFAESFVTSFAGAVGGILLALGGIQIFKRMAPPSVSILGDVTFGWEPLAFAGAVTLGTTLIFGLIPALRAASSDLRALLGDGGRRSSSGVHGSALRSMLVVAEVGVATALVIGSGLLLRSYQNLSSVDPGFQVGEAVKFNVIPPIGLYGNWDDVNQYYDALLTELEALPGADGATFMATMPLGTEYDPLRPIRVMDLAEPLQGEEPQSYLRPVGNNFFDVMGISMLEGRGFNDADGREGAPVAVVNEAFVQRHLPDGHALNRQLSMYSSNWNVIGRLWRRAVRRAVGPGGARHLLPPSAGAVPPSERRHPDQRRPDRALRLGAGPCRRRGPAGGHQRPGNRGGRPAGIHGEPTLHGHAPPGVRGGGPGHGHGRDLRRRVVPGHRTDPRDGGAHVHRRDAGRGPDAHPQVQRTGLGPGHRGGNRRRRPAPAGRGKPAVRHHRHRPRHLRGGRHDPVPGVPGRHGDPRRAHHPLAACQRAQGELRARPPGTARSSLGAA